MTAGEGDAPAGPPAEVRAIDPRAVRVALAQPSAHAGLEPVVVEPPHAQKGSSNEHRLDRYDAVHGVLVEGTGDAVRRTPVILLPPERPAHSSGVVRREVIVGGWRVEVEIESERRASLRERASRGSGATARSGPTPIRAIIPGRIVSVSIVAGDSVEAGQQLLVVEAMKMQNELRAPRAGIVTSVPVGVGGTIEVGDTLVVLE